MRRLSPFGISHRDFLARVFASRACHQPPGHPAIPWKSTILAGLISASLACTICPAASAQDPDMGQSFYVPQAGSVASPLEGTAATRFFRACPNNDGTSSLPNNVRIKVTLRDASGGPLAGYSKSKIYIRFNGGTLAQGFTGPGADSIIANATFNPLANCPDLTQLFADADTDVQGETYITFAGSSPSPGVAMRDPNRKWGHYDSDIPVFVEPSAGPPQLLSGRIDATSAQGSYVLRIKNVDHVGGLGTTLNVGELVNTLDRNPLQAAFGSPSYWLDFDSSGAVNTTDFNIMVFHLDHRCNFPFNP